MASVSCPFPRVSRPPFPSVSPPFRHVPPPPPSCRLTHGSLHTTRLNALSRIAVIRAVRGDGVGDRAEDDDDDDDDAGEASARQEILGNAGNEEGTLGESHDDDDLQEMLKNSDWRAFRARLLQKSGQNMVPSSSSSSLIESSSTGLDLWAHPLSQPEQGCLIIANPTAFLTQQQYFHQAVIFLFFHSKDGSAGLILNRPTEYNLGQLAGFEDLLPDFASCPLYMGGDVGANALHVVHGVVGLKDTLEIIPGVYMGGLNSMKSSVQNGESSASDYRWFVRYAGWGPGQLEREVAMGVWYLASSSKHVILKHCIRLPKPLWREVLEYMGGPYVDISRRAYGEI